MSEAARERITNLCFGTALACLGWICLAPWPLTDAPSDIDRRGLIWALALSSLLLPMLAWRALRLAGPAVGLALLAWLTADLLAASFAVHPWPAWLGGPERGLGLLDHLAWLGCLLALLGVLASLPPALAEARSRQIIVVLIGLGVTMALGMLVEASWSILAERPARAAGVLGNASYSASVLAPLLVLATGFWRRARSHRGVWLALVIVLAAGLLASGGRGGMLAAAVGMAWLWLRVSKRTPAVGQADRAIVVGHRARLALVTALVLLGGALLAQLRPASVEIRAHLYHAAARAPLQANALQRWDGSVDPQSDLRLWIGHGRDNIEPPLTRLRAAALNRLETRGFDRLADRSHSALFDRWVEGGLCALATTLVLIGLLIRRARATAAGPHALRDLCAAALVTALLDRAVGVPSAGADLLLALLLALNLRLWLGSAVSADDEPMSPTPPAAWLSLLPGAAALPVLLLLGAGLAGAQHWLWHDPDSPALTIAEPGCAPMRSDPAAAIAVAQLAYSVRPWLGLERAPPAACANPDVLADFLVHAAPTLPRAWLVRAALLLERGDVAAAHGALGQALTLFGPAVDRSEQARLAYLWAGLADRSAGQQQQDAARRALAALHALGPAGDDDPAWWRTTAYMHALVGELAPAAKAWRRAVAIDPGDQRSRRNLERIEQVMRARSAGD